MRPSFPHESAVGHVTGAAVYVDDLQPPGCLHGVLVPSPVAHGRLVAIDARRARSMPGVVAVLTEAEVPGALTIGPAVHDEPLLARGTVHFKGQALALVLAKDRERARRAALEVQVEIEALPPVLELEQAAAAGAFFGEDHVIARGAPEAVLARLPAEGGVVIEGEVRTGGQDHFYLETHCALCLPEEGGTLRILSSTQHPTEVQRMAARVLGIAQQRIVCEVPRMGGGFGGKESQATAPACLAALGTFATGRPTKIWLSRHEDMAWTGGRHPFLGRYRAGFDAQGRFQAFMVQLLADGGWTADLSLPIIDRALFHLDGACYLPHVRLQARACRTNKPSATAFRGFGGPQGMVVHMDAVRRASRALGLPVETVLRRSYYGVPRPDGDPALSAPYGETVPAPRIAAMHDQLLAQADLDGRRAALADWNRQYAWNKRGIGFMPVKFGISFTMSLLNQAGALVLVFADGSVQVNHGGTEMGQGLHTKMRTVCAEILGIEVGDVRVMRTSTDKVPNTSATAASSGADLNGQAVAEAARSIRERMAPVAAELLGTRAEFVRFAGGAVNGPDGQSLPFSQLAAQCWLRRVSLSSTGFYATPGIAYDRQKGQGTPFFYYAYGACLVEVEVLGLTGEHRIRRIDILHDVGDSLVPAIDQGQVLGALTQGLGWLTTEEVVFHKDGGVLTRGPSTYKVPAAGDLPLDLRISLLPEAAEPQVIGGSKAVGEPPFMLAIAVLGALEEAIGAFGPGEFRLAIPATGEAILEAVEAARGQ